MGAESTGAAATDAGLLVCAFRRNTSAPPARKAPTTQGVQLVSPSRRSGRLSAETAAASFGGILADVPSPAGVRNDSLATRSCSRSRSCFAFRAAALPHQRPLFSSRYHVVLPQAVFKAVVILAEEECDPARLLAQVLQD